MKYHLLSELIISLRKKNAIYIQIILYYYALFNIVNNYIIDKEKGFKVRYHKEKELSSEAKQKIKSIIIEDKDIVMSADGDATDNVAGVKKFAYELKDAYDQYGVKGDHDSGYTFELKDDADDTAYDKVYFGFTGLVNQNADWSNFAAETDADTLSLNVSYTVKKLGAEYDDITAGSVEDVSFVDGVTGLLSTETAPAVEAAPSAPEAADFQNGYLRETGYSTVINDVSLGKAGLAATDIKSIKLAKTSGATTGTVVKELTSASGTGYMYDAEAETLTLYGPVITAATKSNAATENGKKYYLIIEFDDAAGTKVEIELTNRVTIE